MRAVRFGALCLFLLSCHFQARTALAQAVPDAPAPQTAPPSAPVPNAPTPAQPSSLGSLTSQVAPGKSAGNPDSDQDQNTSGQAAPKQGNGTVQTAPDITGPDDFQKSAPMMPVPGQAPGPPPPPAAAVPADASTTTFHTGVTLVDVPVTVRDKHNQLVAGLPWWRFRIYEDGVRQKIWYFTTDAYPLSVAFVIDGTLPADIMQKVNASLSVVTNSLTASDSVAVISYAGTGPQLVTDFTGANGARLSAALIQAKRPGQSMGVPETGGPFSSGPQINGQQADPTLAPQPGNAGFIMIPHETHPLADAILYAAEQLASQPRGRRRIIYVVSDGKDVRSKAKYKEVLEYLLTNNIGVYGTEVGDASLWGIGYLDRMKIPFLAPENMLPRFAYPTGGDVQAELTENGIQSAFVHITESVRTAYTIDYLSHQPAISNKYHQIEVRVEGLPGLNVDAKTGYYPSATASQY